MDESWITIGGGPNWAWKSVLMSAYPERNAGASIRASQNGSGQYNRQGNHKENSAYSEACRRINFPPPEVLASTWRLAFATACATAAGGPFPSRLERGHDVIGR